MNDLTQALADRIGCSTDNIVLAAGSGELLKTAAQAFTGPHRHLVTASPSYMQTPRVAQYLDAEVKSIAITADGMLDLDAMADAARGAGLIFFCNPNNPTGTVHTASEVRRFVETVQRTSPETVIHLDEAYHEYVTHPDYESAAGMATEMENVFVSRTFSKCFGMAGMPASEFRDACAEHNVLVGRDFPPYQEEWMRISLGTMDEMERAVKVFGRILPATAGQRQRGSEVAA